MIDFLPSIVRMAPGWKLANEKASRAFPGARAEIHIDPFDVVHYLREQGHTFSTIARDIPSGLSETLTGGASAVRRYEQQSARRREK